MTGTRTVSRGGRACRLTPTLALLLALAACTGPGSAVPQGIGEGNRAPDFALEALDGSKVSLKDQRGNVVLINFWATWCSPCRAEIPDIEAYYQTHRGQGFVVLGVNVEEAKGAIQPFVSSLNMTYPVLLDSNSQVMKKYRALGLPMSVVVDREGVIQVRHTGLLTQAQLDDYVRPLLAQRQD